MPKVDSYPVPDFCPYCGSFVVFTSNAAVYGKEYGNGKCYKCASCDAYVGVHTGTTIPLGRLADQRLRSFKKMAHRQFDAAWKSGKTTRSRAYKCLAYFLGIPLHECHIGWFDEKTTCKVIELTTIPNWYQDVEL